MLDAKPESLSSLLQITDEFLKRYWNGERPSAKEYIDRHPALADEIADLLRGAIGLEEVSELYRLPPGPTEPASAIIWEQLPTTFGRYRLTQLLGQGTMARVYLASDTGLGRQLAVKIPKFERDDSESIQRFQREARAMATVHHPNICSVYDIGKTNSVHFLTMEFIEGKTLDSVLNERRFTDQQAASLIETISRAVHEAHEAGVVHRDLKPANIMIDETGTPKVMDFGLARLERRNEAELTKSGTILGSPAYMAPEQVMADHCRIGPATDVYALGVILYLILDGNKPFDGSTFSVMKQIETKVPPPISRSRGVSPSIESICLKAMAKRPECRYASAKELADELREFAAGSYTKIQFPRVTWIGTATVAFSILLILLIVSVKYSSNNGLKDQLRMPDDIQLRKESKDSLLLPPRPIARVKSTATFVSHGDPVAGTVRAVALGDLDGDLDLDAFLVRFDKKLIVMINDGNGKFSPGPPIDDPDTWRNWDVALGDSDGDGDLDAFVTRNGIDRLWLNNGKAVFVDSGVSFGNGESNQPAFGDIDGDEDLDIVVPQNGQCLVWINDGKGQFSDSGQRLLPEYYCGCGLGDLNGDGYLDIFVGTVSNTPAQVWFNDGEGVFIDSKQRLSRGSTWSIQIVDWDNDNDLDAILANDDTPTELWINDGRGTFLLSQQGDVSYETHAAYSADLDGDGDFDIFESNNGKGEPDIIWLTDGSRAFARKSELPAIPAERCELGDLDGDGDIDIFGKRAWINQN